MDLSELLTLAGIGKETEHEIEPEMSPIPVQDEKQGMRHLIAIISPSEYEEEIEEEPAPCGCHAAMGESNEERFSGSKNDRWGNSANGEAGPSDGPEEFEDGISTLGSDSDTSLRRLIKANPQPVRVEEAVYPDYTVNEMKSAYAAYIKG
jgi:hypothetical protein